MEKILLIEDNEALRDNTAEILSLANYEVSTAENGKIGVEMAMANPPDLIVCDIMMPVLDGYGVFQIISKNLELQHIMNDVVQYNKVDCQVLYEIITYLRNNHI